MLVRASRLSLVLVALLTAAAPARGAAPLQPLVRLNFIELRCAGTLGGFGGGDYCIHWVFQERDITVFRDGKGLAVSTLQERVDNQPGSATAEVRRGTIPPARLAALHSLLAEVKIGTNPGACHPRPGITRIDAHYQLVWYGLNFRQNVIALSTEETVQCSVELRTLLRTLSDIGVALPLAP
ncbi:MAG TPA: hypothetical protein VF121_12015 [Thermoanaerobaculia bacterium]|nr:hypothetical protein [Thermoanaerobaculia bacterium]